MRIVILTVVGLVVLVMLMFVAGMLLPKNHRAASRITLQKSPDQVWPLIRDLGSLEGTWPELKSATRLPDEGGKEVWQQNAGGFPMRIIIEEAAPPAKLVTRIDAAPDAAFGGTWTYQLDPAGTGTTVTVTEDGYVSNPLFRVMMKVMGVHRTADGYLVALGKKLGETVKPEHVK